MRIFTVISISLLFVLFSPGEGAAEPGDENSAREDVQRSAQRRRRRRRRRRPPPTPEENEAPEAEAATTEAESTPAESEGPRTNAEVSAEVNAAAEGESTEEGMRTTGNLRRSNRMEFDTRLVRGQTAGAGAVVLFNRGSRPLPPLTGERKGFTRETVRDVLGAIDRNPNRRRDDDSRRSRRRRRR